ncbi:hypothetical protein ACNPM9_15500 [Klebsiella michiganensis]|uniref:hypothetical protein n=1 Tax=Klebsiella michiganensis TaxID=1134687 RepID=UPI00190CADC9|nr:hypothetical protein [Klebsiella michiganensis]ELG9969803.1 hypothetical protein [Klebsiella michiganensis]QQO69547.1 hypothetical protein IE970_12965 [Klebsiella michiganensis]HCT4798570.1 hypothetical protein [Klebsiella michiganensis]
MYLKHGLYRFTLVAALFALTACSWVDGYSSMAHQQLLMLEQLHLQFISDAAAAPLDQRLLSNEDRQIRPLFSLALSDSDALRQSNLHVLEKNYQRLYRRVVPQERALTPFEAGILAQQTEKLYQQAINGEQQRSGR